MNAESSLLLILERVKENIDLFEINQDVNNLTSVICKLGSVALQKSCSCTLLKNIIITLQGLYTKGVLQNFTYKAFLKDVNNFYKSQKLCTMNKITILSCFEPAIEVEVISLLKLCSNVSSVSLMSLVKSAVEDSVLVPACQNNTKTLEKVMQILKQAFIQTLGNPVVGYMNFCLHKTIKQSFCHQILPENLLHINAMFEFPHNLLTEKEQDIFINKLVCICVESIKLNQCTKDDLVFYTSIFPLSYQKMLNIYQEQSSHCILEFFKYLCCDKFNYIESSDWRTATSFAKNNSFWKLIS